MPARSASTALLQAELSFGRQRGGTTRRRRVTRLARARTLRGEAYSGPRLVHHLDNARRRLRDFGPAYVVLAPIRRAAQIVDARIEQRQLTIEGRRGVLGEAHRAWRDHAPEVNKERWGGWDWSRHGEEWTVSAEWKQALIADVLFPTIPEGGTVLEIGPGAGRWTEVLSPGPTS